MVSRKPNASKRFKSLIYRGLIFILTLTAGAAPEDAFAEPGVGPADAPESSKVAASPEVARMLAALERYQRIAESGGWPAVPPGPTIRPGSNDPRIATLAQRLAATGDFDSDRFVGAEFDAELEDAVMRFQSRHGLETDMLVGRKTLQALNVPVTARLAQLRINLQRIREVFDADRNEFLLVNVPAFQVHLVRDGKTVWTEKVIVGEPETETPLFESAITHVVFNPTWTVPRKIATEELLPKIKDDIAFLARGGYVVIDAAGTPVEPLHIDWADLHKNNFPYTLVQQPGPMNELGRIKYLFPNDYGICMHDTPGRYLFAKGSRALSHGCIRIAEPLDVAGQLLEPHGWTHDKIAALLNDSKTRTIGLPSSMPVVITYLTARVAEDGTVNFFHDIYGRDAAVSTARAP